MKYWVISASKEHAMMGVDGGFIQAGHGKLAPLKRMEKGDMIIIYSSKAFMNDAEKYQKFTAIGEISDDEIFQYKMSDDFIPYRRRANFSECKEADIRPLINELEFIQNKKQWGYPFRFGVFEIQEMDFNLIKAQMKKD